MNQRDNTWDAVKGIGIILMVVGHSGCPLMMHDFIYLFHMGLFFFVSGRFLKVGLGGQFLKFVNKKIKGLYLPFVKWGLIFTVLHNVFYFLGWYEDAYTFGKVVRQMLMVLTFKSIDEPLLGPIWFLKSLFFGCVITYLICLLHNKKLQIGIVVLLYLIAWICGSVFLPYMINREIGIVIAIYLGYRLKNNKMECSWTVFSLISVILLVMAYYVKIDIIACMWGPLGAFPVYAVMGVLLSRKIVVWIEEKVKCVFAVLTNIGRNSLYILIFHFTGFHILSTLLVYCGVGEQTTLSNVTVLSGINHTIWFVVYSVFGIIFSLLYPQAKKIIIKK